MKNLLFSIIIMTLPQFMFSQFDCDILTPGISSNPSSIIVGQTSDLVFTVYNDAQGSDCCYPAESVLVYVFLPENGGLTFQAVVSPPGGTGPYFEWVYDPVVSTVIGTNHAAICDAQGELDVTVRVIGSALPNYPQNRTVGITILNNPDGPPYTSNNEGNDNGITTLTINAPLPVELANFRAEAVGCHQVDIYWETASEINNDFFEIQRSTDGIHFGTIAKMKGTNQSVGSRYTVSDSDISPSSTYTYRLRQVDFDGSETVFNPISVRTKVCYDDVSIAIYPNPATDKTFLDLSGFDESQQWDILITNVLGETVRFMKKPTAKNKIELNISEFPAGIYNVKIENQTNSYTQRFIKI